MKIHTLTLNPSVDRMLWVPGFSAGGHFAAKRTALVPAGKGINVARYLKALGAEPVTWALVGRHELVVYQQELARHGIRARLYPVRGSTRQNITIIEPERGETHIREPGFQVVEREWRLLLSELAAGSAPGDAVALSGSIPGGLGSRHIAAFFKALSGRRIFLDVSSTDLPLERAPSGTGITLKLNAREFEALSGQPADRRGCRSFAARFPAIERIVVTDGPREILWFSGEGVFKAQPPAVEAINTVGAGDAFLAGLLVGLWRRLAAEECLRLATAAASAKVGETFVGELDASKVHELVSKVAVTRI